MKNLIVCLLILVPLASIGQKRTKASQSELGIMLGGTYYIGDMNQFFHYRNTNLAGGLIFRYNLHSRVAVRANLLYGKVNGSDSDNKNEAVLLERNLNFSSTIYEGGVGFEFNYFPFQIGHHRYKGTAYLLAELAMFRMNPKTEYNGEEYELQSMGTEGQGTSFSNQKNYSLMQLSIPLGLGIKLSVGKRASLNFEFGLRKTFTDYLDDIGSNKYADQAIIAAENGPLAAELSNRSLSQSRYGMRGNSSTKDWYVFSGAMFTFRLGDPKRCKQP
jgi:hypothetical protein